MTIRPALAILLLSALAVVGCAPTASDTEPPPPPTPIPASDVEAGAPSDPLTATSWRLVDLGGTAPAESVEATLEFPEAGKVAGRGSCNRFFGTVEISGEAIRFGPLAATKMSCPGPADAQEVKYLGALQGAERFAIDGTELAVYSKGMEKPLRFARK